MDDTGTCPVCNGSCRQPYTGDRRYVKYISGYDAATDTIACQNCGGQTMAMRGTGTVRRRPDGTPCTHKYITTTIRNCLHESKCEHCGDSFRIDSGD